MPVSYEPIRRSHFLKGKLRTHPVDVELQVWPPVVTELTCEERDGVSPLAIAVEIMPLGLLCNALELCFIGMSLSKLQLRSGMRQLNPSHGSQAAKRNKDVQCCDLSCMQESQ